MILLYHYSSFSSVLTNHQALPIQKKRAVGEKVAPTATFMVLHMGTVMDCFNATQEMLVPQEAVLLLKTSARESVGCLLDTQIPELLSTLKESQSLQVESRNHYLTHSSGNSYSQENLRASGLKMDPNLSILSLVL